jgi:hypothetical protein
MGSIPRRRGEADASWGCMPDPHPRAMKLVFLGVSYESAAHSTGQSKSKLPRAVQAARAGRVLG